VRLSQSETAQEGRGAVEAEANDRVAIVSYDEKPGIQAIATTSPDLPPEPGVHATFARDHEYKRHGTVTLLAGIDLVSGKVHAMVEDRHRSREFVGSSSVSTKRIRRHRDPPHPRQSFRAYLQETKAWLAEQPAGRFKFTFTPSMALGFNLVEGFFSKLARSVLRHIRVSSKQELRDRIMAGSTSSIAIRRSHMDLQT